MKLVNLGVNMMVVFTKVMGYHLVHVSYGQVNIGFVSYFSKTAVCQQDRTRAWHGYLTDATNL